MRRLERELEKERIRTALSLVDVIQSSGVELKRNGRTYWARCPFHSERTPSFAVDPVRSTWHCYGACGEGGDVFDWYMRHDGVNFRQALVMAADAAGIEISFRGGGPDRGYMQSLRGVVLSACGYFADNRSRVMPYLETRGIKKETAMEWGLGYATEDWHGLKSHLLREGFSLEALLGAGLIARKFNSDEGSQNPKDYYDFFRNRLMFPIRDARGTVVGFAGRTTDPEERKYINSSQGPLFDKGQLLYGLDRVPMDVRRGTMELLVTEGYLDVISAHQAGINNFVGAMGTALTSSQAVLLSRQTKHRDQIRLVMDGDAAGINAGKKGAASLFEVGLTPRLSLLPDGQDVDDVIRTGGADAFRKIESLDLLGFYLAAHNREHSNTDLGPDEKWNILKEIVDSLRNEPDFSRKIIWISDSACRLGIPERAVEEAWYRRIDSMCHKNGGNVRNLTDVGTRFVAGLLVHSDEWRRPYLDISPDCPFFTPGVRKVYEALQENNPDLPRVLQLGLPNMGGGQRDFVREQEFTKAIDYLNRFSGEGHNSFPHELLTFLLHPQERFHLDASARIIRKEMYHEKRRSLVDALFLAQRNGNPKEVARIEKELDGVLVCGI